MPQARGEGSPAPALLSQPNTGDHSEPWGLRPAGHPGGLASWTAESISDAGKPCTRCLGGDVTELPGPWKCMVFPGREGQLCRLGTNLGLQKRCRHTGIQAKAVGVTINLDQVLSVSVTCRVFLFQ